MTDYLINCQAKCSSQDIFSCHLYFILQWNGMTPLPLQLWSVLRLNNCFLFFFFPDLHLDVVLLFVIAVGNGGFLPVLYLEGSKIFLLCLAIWQRSSFPVHSIHKTSIDIHKLIQYSFSTKPSRYFHITMLSVFALMLSIVPESFSLAIFFIWNRRATDWILVAS